MALTNGPSGSKDSAFDQFRDNYLMLPVPVRKYVWEEALYDLDGEGDSKRKKSRRGKKKEKKDGEEEVLCDSGFTINY